MTERAEKMTRLNDELRKLDSVVVGFSAGVDSSFLAAAAQKILGDRAVAVTACSATLPERERQDATAVADFIGVRHVFLDADEMESTEFVANGADRCYHCKKLRFSRMVEWAKEHGYQWVLDGSNADDVGDYRPGMKAVGELNAVRSPLLEVGLTKAEIRQQSKEWGLPTWDKPSAACLSSRIVYGLPITTERLGQIEQAEEIIRELCRNQVRVRHHGELARIEVSAEDIPVLADPVNSARVVAALKKIGFAFVTLDLAGYRTGSLNETLRNRQ
ncbi:MAG TPA: ATP-dependent sacrificial sulfur transferase LarE [Patescibacteria group bacterium]|nr:ATP-dependent sacrificial sulfur transferase LarE [Patescibacteria group bacterium]